MLEQAGEKVMDVAADDDDDDDNDGEKEALDQTGHARDS